MLAVDFNNIEFDGKELNEYINLGKSNDKKIEELESKVNEKLSRRSMMKVKEEAEAMLQTAEKIEVMLKGADVNELATMIITPHLTSDDYGTHKIIFLTNNRVFIALANHYNKGLKFKTYERNELNSVSYGKKIFHKMSAAEKKNFFVGAVSASVLPIIGIMEREVMVILGYFIFLIAYYWLIKVTHSYAINIILEFNDGYTYELVASKENVQSLKTIYK